MDTLWYKLPREHNQQVHLLDMHDWSILLKVIFFIIVMPTLHMPVAVFPYSIYHFNNRTMKSKSEKLNQILDLPVPDWVLITYSLLFSLLIGWLSHWKVFEFDLFFNVRAGEEILKTGHIQKIDTWSHTYFGQTCYNFEWLSTVIQYLAGKAMAGYRLSGWLRSGLIALWTYFLSRTILTYSGSKRSYLFLVPLLLPWIYCITYFRLQMRPDLFATCLYVIFLSLWYSEKSILTKRKWSLFILFLWSNFHSGTVPIGILIYSVFVLLFPNSSESLTQKAKWIGLGIFTFFCTPLGYLALEPIYNVLFQYDHAIQNNPDFQPFDLKLLSLSEGGWSFRLWILYCLTAFFSYFYLAIEKPQLLPYLFRKRTVFWFLGIGLTLATLFRIRTIHYQVVFLLPIIAAALGSLLGSRQTYLKTLAAGLLGALWIHFWILPDQVLFVTKPIGEGVYEEETPIQNVEFIRKVKPEKNLLNAFDFGGYLIAELPDYPVALDGRGPVQNFLKEKTEASRSTEAYSEFLKKYGINVVLETIPTTLYQPNLGFVDSHSQFFPASEWALVSMDNISVLYLRRIPAHSKIISEYEYHFIKRGLPANYGASWKDLTDPIRAGFEAELEQCLKRFSHNVYCLIGKASFLQKEGHPQEALQILLQAEKILPRNAELLLNLSLLEKELGHLQESEKYQKRFDRLTVQLGE